MRAPLDWLGAYTPVTLEDEALKAKMVMAGNGVEEIIKMGEAVSKVVVGKVLKMERHPNSDHLWICQVDVGQEEPVQIVTGAQNVHEGDFVPAALDGSTLPGGVKIKKGKLRGEVSNGMLCSGEELEVPKELYPSAEDGILILREAYAPGTDIKKVLGIWDTVVDFEVLANRPDTLCITGMARELAAVTGETLTIKTPAFKGIEGTPDVEISVENAELCPRYAARVVRNVRIAPSPMWMRERLHAAGVRPINNIVDITNYVMLEFGHPMHSFDLEQVRGRKIIVRNARAGETVTTLDGKARSLSEQMLVIADGEGPTGVAGVMGGAESEIGEGTKAVLFECAKFDRTSIRTTSRALGMRTEASARFEKGVCTKSVMTALDRACELVELLDAGDVIREAIDVYPSPEAVRTVEGSCEKIRALISVDVKNQQMVGILNSLGIEATVDGDKLSAVVPEWRSDIEHYTDLAEEILRIFGYEHIPSTLMRGVTTVGGRSPERQLEEDIRAALVGLGYFEAYHYSFINPQWVEALGLEKEDKRLVMAPIINPLTSDHAVMRTTLIPGMLRSISTNVKHGVEDIRLFELAPVYYPKALPMADLPDEPKVLCIGLYGGGADFFALKAAAEEMLAAMGITGLESVAEGDTYLHPGRKARLYKGETPLVQLGEIHPNVAEYYDIAGRVYIAEIDFAACLENRVLMHGVKTMPKYPTVSRDLALVMPKGQQVGPVLSVLTKGKFVVEASVFDVYESAQLGQNKSVAFSLLLRSEERTLTDAEIQKTIDDLLKKVAELFGAALRQ